MALAPCSAGQLVILAAPTFIPGGVSPELLPQSGSKSASVAVCLLPGVSR